MVSAFANVGDGQSDLDLERKRLEREMIARHPALTKGAPHVHLDRAHDPQCGDVEVDDDSRREDVLVGHEMGQVVIDRHAEEREGVGLAVLGEVGEEAEAVLGVELAALEITGGVDAAEHVLAEDGGVDHLGLGHVVGEREVLEEVIRHGVELVEGVRRDGAWSRAGGIRAGAVTVDWHGGGEGPRGAQDAEQRTATLHCEGEEERARDAPQKGFEESRADWWWLWKAAEGALPDKV